MLGYVSLFFIPSAFFCFLAGGGGCGAKEWEEERGREGDGGWGLVG